MLFDAGDTVPHYVSTGHTEDSLHTSAFRFVFTFYYFVETSFYNASDSESTFFSINEIELTSFVPNASSNATIGTVSFDADEVMTEVFAVTLLNLLLVEIVRTDAEYEVPFTVVWDSLPFGLDGGRVYSLNGVLVFSTAKEEVSLSYITSNPLTPGTDLQIQEQVSANITVIFREVYLCRRYKVHLVMSQLWLYHAFLPKHGRLIGFFLSL